MTPSKKTTLAYFSAFALLTFLSRLPSLNLLLDTDSSVNAFFARQMLRGETLYDKFHTAHHLPGIYYTNELAFRLFGDQPAAPKILMFGFILAGTWLLFLMGRAFFDDLTGSLGAFFYILGSSQHYLAGSTAEMEHFANLPMIASVYVFLVLLKRKSQPLQFFWVGALTALGILYKVIFIAPLAAIGVSLLLGAWLERKQDGSVKELTSRLAAMALGLALPLALTGAYFASLGLWDRLMLVFTLGFNYAGDQSLIVPFPKPFGFPLFVLAMNNIVMLVLGLFGAFRLVRRSLPLRPTENPANLTLVLWLFFSLILAGFRGGGYQHYVLIVIPPLALTAASEISANYRNWRKTSPEKAARIGAGVLASLIVVNFLWRNYNLYRIYIPDPATGKTGFQAEQAQLSELFGYIRSQTAPQDFIYVWSINLQMYYYADRLPPIDILWPSYVSATGAPERIFDPRTKYIVVDDPEIFARPAWLTQGLEQDYVLETTIDNLEFYRREGD